MSIANSSELFEIKRRVKTTAAACHDSVKLSRRNAECALAEALVTGSDLLRAREILGASHFEQWIADNFKTSEAVTLDSAKVFTTLAASQQKDEILAEPRGLRQAFQSLGIV